MTGTDEYIEPAAAVAEAVRRGDRPGVRRVAPGPATAAAWLG